MNIVLITLAGVVVVVAIVWLSLRDKKLRAPLDAPRPVPYSARKP